jgi:hypothetical protein
MMMNISIYKANQQQLKDLIPQINSKKRKANPEEIKITTRILRGKK